MISGWKAGPSPHRLSPLSLSWVLPWFLWPLRSQTAWIWGSACVCKVGLCAAPQVCSLSPKQAQDNITGVRLLRKEVLQDVSVIRLWGRTMPLSGGLSSTGGLGEVDRDHFCPGRGLGRHPSAWATWHGRWWGLGLISIFFSIYPDLPGSHICLGLFGWFPSFFLTCCAFPSPS